MLIRLKILLQFLSNYFTKFFKFHYIIYITNYIIYITNYFIAVRGSPVQKLASNTNAPIHTTVTMANTEPVTKTTQAGMSGIQVLATAAAATQKMNVGASPQIKIGKYT